MGNWILRRYQRKEITGAALREQVGKVAGLVGITSNLILFLLKLIIGILSSSISIMADATNNLSDCASSVITLAGFKLAGMPADEQHPYGHARYEYISGLAVATLIIIIGFEFLTGSIEKIRNLEPVIFTPVVLVVLVISIGIKLWQSRLNETLGKAIESTTLIATATDSRNDVLTTTAVLTATVISYFTGWNLDGWIGALVAGFVLLSGGKLMGVTISPLLGQAPDSTLVEEIQKRIHSYDSVIGTHDLMVHTYGPNRCFASVHVEVPASQDIMISHDIIDNIERDFSREMNISLVIHLDPVVVDDQRVNEVHKYLASEVAKIDSVLTIHDFRMVEGASHTNLIFDVAVPPRYKMSDSVLREKIAACTKQLKGVYYCIITVDRSYTSTTQSMRKDK